MKEKIENKSTKDDVEGQLPPCVQQSSVGMYQLRLKPLKGQW